VDRALRYKRRQDAWTVLKYVTASEETPTASDSTGLSPGDEDLSTLRMRFTTSAEKIEAAAEVPGTRLGCAADLHQALRALISATARMRASRNIVLICMASADTFTSDITAEIDEAHMASIAVHMITPWPTDPMHTMCARTGGTLVTAASPAEIPEALEALCASLLNSYEIGYQSHNPAASKLRLQIYTDTFMGEACQPLA
jgi:hypothetical protein